MRRLLVAAVVAAALQTGPLALGQAVNPQPATTGNLYDPAAVRTLHLQFSGADWDDRLAALYQSEMDLPATVVVDGQTYRDVGVQYRGASSYRMVGPRAKKSLDLSFDAVHEDQSLLGYRSLNLLNGNGDASFVRTRLYSDIARQYIPTPRTNYLRLTINGESWGAYINQQQFNDDFTREWFKSTKGARWKVPGRPRGRGGMEYLGEDPDDYRYLYEIKSKDSPESWKALISMFRVLNETPLDKLEAALAPVLDIDGVLRFLAVEVALVNSDGYWTRASDYNIYLDERGQFHVVPHDFNETMSGDSYWNGGPSLDPLVAVNDPGKPLRSRLLQVPALRERYLGYVRDIAEKWLDWQKLEPIVQQYRAQIADDMKADPRKLMSYEQFERGPESIRRFVEARRQYLLAR